MVTAFATPGQQGLARYLAVGEVVHTLTKIINSLPLSAAGLMLGLAAFLRMFSVLLFMLGVTVVHTTRPKAE